MGEQYSIAFCLIADLAVRDGVRACDLEGCWERQIDDRWWVALNGHKEQRHCATGEVVPPYHAYVTCNGWPAGILNPFSGEIIAHQEDELIAALEGAGAALAQED